MQATLLIVDDDTAFARAAAVLARKQGYTVHLAHSVQQAREHVARQRMDLMLLDLELPDGSGLDLLDDLDLAQHGHVVVITGNPTIESAARAVGMPVVEYLIKPLDGQTLQSLFERTLHRTWQPVVEVSLGVAGLVGKSHVMQQVVDTVLRVGPSDASVLIAGESGTGKELVARGLHDASGRKGAFIDLNCGAVPSELLASQLFGHERGSFTGAHSRHVGVFEQAAHGTLFLDEITEMPLPLQVYLLRVLETGNITRVGGAESIATPVRIVAATNRDPLAAVAAGTLREDLYYRLADIPLTLPPLRDRGEDVVLLANMFIERLNARYGRSKYLSHDAIARILQHPWPGNVRELRSAVQRAYLMDPGDGLRVCPARIKPAEPQETATTIVFTVGMSLAEVERRVLQKTLAYHGHDKTATARALGVSVRTIHNHLARQSEEDANAAA